MSVFEVFGPVDLVDPRDHPLLLLADRMAKVQVSYIDPTAYVAVTNLDHSVDSWRPASYEFSRYLVQGLGEGIMN